MKLLDRILQEIEEYQLSDNQKIGILFHIGFTINQYGRYLGVYGRDGLMENEPITHILNPGFEVSEEDQHISSDGIRECYYTFAKVIHESWAESEQALTDYINVGPQFFFTGDINSTIWENNLNTDFIGINIDHATLDFFECLGMSLDEIDPTNFENYLWHGNYLGMLGMLDDYQSYSFVVDKINTVLSPYLKTFITYPLSIELDKENFNTTDLYSQIFASSIKLEGNKTFHKKAVEWQREIMLNKFGKLNVEYDFFNSNLGAILYKLALNGFQFKMSLTSEEFQEIKGSGNVFDLGELSDLDLGKYVNIITQITHQQFGYDFREPNWANKGIYLQFLSFYFILSMRYSVHFGNLTDHAN